MNLAIIIAVIGIFLGVVGFFQTNEKSLKILAFICAIGNVIVFILACK